MREGTALSKKALHSHVTILSNENTADREITEGYFSFLTSYGFRSANHLQIPRS